MKNKIFSRFFWKQTFSYFSLESVRVSFQQKRFPSSLFSQIPQTKRILGSQNCSAYRKSDYLRVYSNAMSEFASAFFSCSISSSFLFSPFSASQLKCVRPFHAPPILGHVSHMLFCTLLPSRHTALLVRLSVRCFSGILFRRIELEKKIFSESVFFLVSTLLTSWLHADLHPDLQLVLCICLVGFARTAFGAPFHSFFAVRKKQVLSCVELPILPVLGRIVDEVIHHFFSVKRIVPSMK